MPIFLKRLANAFLSVILIIPDKSNIVNRVYSIYERGAAHPPFHPKRKPPNCGNSPAARRASENADAICHKSNREASETQVLFL